MPCRLFSLHDRLRSSHRAKYAIGRTSLGYDSKHVAMLSCDTPTRTHAAGGNGLGAPSIVLYLQLPKMGTTEC